MKVSARHDAIADTVARLRSAWDGEAQRAYDRAHQQWSIAIVSMKAALAEATRSLITANSISMATADTAARVWT